MITLKDIIRVNQEIGESGELHNSSSLEFALSMIRKKRSWLHELSYLLRSLLVDHAFRDGNKRTALALTIQYFAERDIDYDRQRAVLAVHKIAKQNIKHIEKIARVVNNVIIR